jgi:hypothetical protein
LSFARPKNANPQDRFLTLRNDVENQVSDFKYVENQVSDFQNVENYRQCRLYLTAGASSQGCCDQRQVGIKIQRLKLRVQRSFESGTKKKKASV